MRASLPDVLTDVTSYGSAWFSLISLLYTGIVSVCLRAVNCRSAPGIVYAYPSYSNDVRWWFDGSIECLTKWQALPICVLVILFPAPLFLVAWSRRWERGNFKYWWEKGFSFSYGKHFRPRWKNWNAVLIYERLILVVITQTIADPFDRAMTVTALIIAVLIVETLVRAFHNRDVLRLHILAMAILAILAVLQLQSASLQDAGLSSTSAEQQSLRFRISWISWTLTFIPIFGAVFLVVRVLLEGAGESVSIPKVVDSTAIVPMQRPRFGTFGRGSS